MRNKPTILILILLFVFICLGGVKNVESAAEFDPEAESVEETQLNETEQAAEETVLITEPMSTITIDTAIESVATEPPSTEPDEIEPTEPPLISLGTFKLTAYCSCQKCCGSYALNRPVDEDGNEIVYGAMGVRLEAGVSIAVDPRVIPYGAQVIIDGHTYTAHDTGGNIKGNRIDVYFDDHQEAWNFGTQYAEVYVYAAEN